MTLRYLQLISASLQTNAITLQNKLNKCKAVWLLKNNKCGYQSWLDIPLWVLPTETNLMPNWNEKGKPEPGSWKWVVTFLITNICPAIIKSTAPYSQLFPWCYTCSTHLHELANNFHHCKTLYKQQLSHTVYFNFWSHFQ